ncbi:unnamed protein product [Linum trigynum]|uniref:Uncharacterized protein n=1 Tax=Linum trigynum TaxID=586398 RepID=A0AAV2ECV1_9ROSI
MMRVATVVCGQRRREIQPCGEYAVVRGETTVLFNRWWCRDSNRGGTKLMWAHVTSTQGRLENGCEAVEDYNFVKKDGACGNS